MAWIALRAACAALRGEGLGWLGVAWGGLRWLGLPWGQEGLSGMDFLKGGLHCFEGRGLGLP